MANLVQVNQGTALWFVPAGATQAEDAIFEIDGLATGAGRQSAQIDFGIAAREYIFAWRAFVQFATAPVVGEVVRIYLKTSNDDTIDHPDNDDGTGDAAVSAEDKLKNLTQIGTIIVDEAVQDIEMVASGVVDIRAEVVQVVFWNATADALTTDENENGFLLTPIAEEIQ